MGGGSEDSDVAWGQVLTGGGGCTLRKGPFSGSIPRDRGLSALWRHACSLTTTPKGASSWQHQGGRTLAEQSQRCPECWLNLSYPPSLCLRAPLSATRSQIRNTSLQHFLQLPSTAGPDENARGCPGHPGVPQMALGDTDSSPGPLSKAVSGFIRCQITR